MFAALVLAALLQETDRVHVDAPAGEITLAGRNSVLRLHADPSKFDVITDMAVYRGRLVASACYEFDGRTMLSPWAYSHESQLFEYSPAKNEWTLLKEFPVSMFLNLRVVDDKLMIPEFHPFEERSRLVHTWDGADWSALGLLPRQNWHVMDVLRVGKKLYVSGSWRDISPDAPKNDPGWWPGYGRVFESADDGKTWTQIRRTGENGRVLDMVEFQGRLFANERGMRLIAWDGAAWEEIPVRLGKTRVDAKLGSAHLAVFAGRILAINADLYYTYDGKEWTSHTPGYIDLWREGDTMFGLREDGHVWTTTDALKWTKLTREGVPAREFDRMAEKGRPLHRGSIALHRGRLFVGTGAEGAIYAAPYEEKGSWTSAPREVAAGASLKLAAGPAVPGAAVRWRSAESADRLARASWRDAAAGDSELALPRRNAWVQLRVDLQSDGRTTPVVRVPSLAP